MDRSYRILPTYTGDVSGAASALYELGGMVVIHDPSGCNSTYNTHDEIRWYDRESLIFITGLSARDAVLGNDNKLVNDVCDAAEYYRPAFIALVSSPIPYLNGTDFPALARIIERRTGIRTFFVMTNGMHDYVRGAGNALARIAENFVEKKDEAEASASVPLCPEGSVSKQDLTALREAAERAGSTAPQREDAAAREPAADDTAAREPASDGTASRVPASDGTAAWEPASDDTAAREPASDGTAARAPAADDTAAPPRLKVNILGLTPLDFAAKGAVDRLRAILAQHGFEVLTCWAMGSTLGELKRSAEADVDLVVSATGLQTAHYLEKAFGIPFVAGLPVGGFTEPLMNALAEAARTGLSALPCRDFRKVNAAEEGLANACVVGEAVAAGSYAAAMELAAGRGFSVITSLEDSAELLGPGDLFVTGEAEAEEAMKDMEIIAGDAFYEAVCPAGGEFISLPHLAFSGRNAVRDLTAMDPYDIDGLLAARHRLM